MPAVQPPSQPSDPSRVVTFGTFAIDLGTGELRRDGRRVRLQGIPLQVLEALLERPGQLLTRRQLRERIWPDDVYGDFDNSLNSAVNRLRAALGDAAENPRFVETLPRRGYRFIAPVTPAAASVAPASVAAPSRARLAVLPFRNLGTGPDEDYFSDGLTEEIIAQTGRLAPRRLGVIASTSAMRYKDLSRSVVEIGEELDVDYLLEGSVRRQDDRVRITARLIQRNDQAQIWSATYERCSSDALTLHAEVAEAVSQKVGALLAPSADVPFAALRRPAAPEAYRAYLEGRYAWNRRNAEALFQAVKDFERAIALDPDYAPAYVGLADAYLVLSSYSLLPATEALPEARAAARRALEIDGTLAEAHASLAAVTLELDWDFAGADRQFRHALELAPNYATAYQWYGEHLSMAARHEEALAVTRRAAELDPLSPIIQAMIGSALYFARRHDEAVAVLESTLELYPEFLMAYVFLGCAHAARGAHAEALAATERAAAAPGAPAGIHALRGYVLAVAGERARARAVLAELLDGRRKPPVSPYMIASLLAALGRRTESLAWLERARAEHDRWLLYLAVDPRLDDLRSDPRFAVFRQSLGI